MIQRSLARAGRRDSASAPESLPCARVGKCPAPRLSLDLSHAAAAWPTSTESVLIPEKDDGLVPQEAGASKAGLRESRSHTSHRLRNARGLLSEFCCGCFWGSALLGCEPEVAHKRRTWTHRSWCVCMGAGGSGREEAGREWQGAPERQPRLVTHRRRPSVFHF